MNTQAYAGRVKILFEVLGAPCGLLGALWLIEWAAGPLGPGWIDRDRDGQRRKRR